MVWAFGAALGIPKRNCFGDKVSKAKFSTLSNHLQMASQKVWTEWHSKRKCMMESTRPHKSHSSETLMRICFKYLLQGRTLFKILKCRDWSLVSLVALYTLRLASFQSSKSTIRRGSPSSSDQRRNAALLVLACSMKALYIILELAASMSVG